MPNDFITLLEAVPLFPTRPHKNTIIRWANRGLGGVRLKSIRFGGKRLTRPIWVDEFNNAVMGTNPNERADSSVPTSSQKNVEAKLDALGVN